jgi:tetratricopeptide (TPR) repeat protein
VTAYGKVADVFRNPNDHEKLIEYYQKARIPRVALAAAEPRNWLPLRNLWVNYIRVGDSLRILNRTDEALASYQESLPIIEQVTAMAPHDLRSQGYLRSTYERLGNILFRQARRDEALNNFRKALVVADRVVAHDPGDPQTQLDLAGVLLTLGRAGDNPRPNLTRALEIAQKLDASGKLPVNRRGFILNIQRSLNESSPPSEPQPKDSTN